jgi:hypothetical protein
MPVTDAKPEEKAILLRGSKTKKARGGPKIPKTKHKRRQLDMRARWIVREWGRDPTLTYAESVDALRERFQIGWSSAENACARGNEMMSEITVEQNTVERLYQQLATIVQEARDAGRYQAAIRGVMAQAELGGLLDRVPQVQITNIQQFAHLQAVTMTPTQRTQRERELFSAAELRAAQEAKSANVGQLKSPIGTIVDEEFSLPFGDGEASEVRDDTD